MTMSHEFDEWDLIFDQLNAYLKEHPEKKYIENTISFVDDTGKTCCTKCGSSENIGECYDCKQEKNYLS